MSAFRQPIKVRRLSGGALVQGRWTGQVEAEITIMASVQPAGPKELQALEEGRRTRASFTLFTDTKLETVKSQNPDRVILFGDDYEAVQISPWQNGVLPHFEILVQKREPVNA